MSKRTPPPRFVYSVNITDANMAAFIDKRCESHLNGISGYFRSLVEKDVAEWNRMKEVRMRAMVKLTAEEIKALGLEGVE